MISLTVILSPALVIEKLIKCGRAGSANVSIGLRCWKSSVRLTVRILHKDNETIENRLNPDRTTEAVGTDLARKSYKRRHRRLYQQATPNADGVSCPGERPTQLSYASGQPSLASRNIALRTNCHCFSTMARSPYWVTRRAQGAI